MILNIARKELKSLFASPMGWIILALLMMAFGSYYHIYNRGINSCNLFGETANYEYFLTLYDHYISPIADTFAWVLMPNHFHVLIRIKNEDEIISSNLTGF